SDLVFLVCAYIFCAFFFSSRRRHTRSKRDWSSDVCSSDLVEDAKKFVAAGVDKLACGIGNIHGVYPADWKGLNFDRLKEIAEAVPDTPLVLHGGSGIPEDQVKKAIKLGIAKININTEFQLAFQEATRKYI